jgi:hypothetical protein
MFWRTVLPSIFTTLHGMTAQKMTKSIFTVMETSNLTSYQSYLPLLNSLTVTTILENIKVWTFALKFLLTHPVRTSQAYHGEKYDIEE